MRDVARVLKKQRQLIEIEIGSAKLNQSLGLPFMHPDSYYIKMAASLSLINKLINTLESTEEDIYENFKYIEH